MTNKSGGSHSGMTVITVCSGKGGVGKTTAVRAFTDELKNSYRIAVVDGALGLTGISSVYGVFPEDDKSYEAFLAGRKPASEFIHKVEGINLIPSGINGNVTYPSVNRSFHRINELIRFLSANNDIVIIDSASGLDLGLYEYLNLSDVVIIVVTADPQSVTDGYAICKLSLSMTPQPGVSFLLNMAESENDYLNFNVKMALLTGKFLGREIGAMGYLKFDNFFMKSPGDVEFRSMIGNDNRSNMEELVKKLEAKISPNIVGGKKQFPVLNSVLSPVNFDRELERKSTDDIDSNRSQPFRPGGKI